MFLVRWFLFLVILRSGSSRRTFFRGRQDHSGGNLGIPRSHDQHTTPKEQWFEQRLNHFNPVDERTWKQRFFTNNKYFGGNRNGPVFLQIGGEGEASPKWLKDDTPWIMYAKKYNALCFLVEHRYYGKSHPTSDLSTKNLQYLTSQQALADLAAFISATNEKYHFSSDVKWIVFGGSYSGSLAAWMREKYPYLVHGAMSASGPLLAKVDFQEYFQVVEESLRTYSDECVEEVKSSFRQTASLMSTPKGRKVVNKLFRSCNPDEDYRTHKYDVSAFFETLASDFAGIVQYNKDNRENGSYTTIDDLCGLMTNASLGTAMRRLAAVNDLVNLQGATCENYTYESSIVDLRNVSYRALAGGRAWMYQTCTEFGFFQSSSQPTHVFGNAFPAEFFVQQCEDVFGPKYDDSFLDASVSRTNTMYGALDIRATNVVFVQGSVDPWHALGITKTMEQGAPAIYIEGTAHCANMYPPSENDLPQLKAARVQIEDLIGTWLLH